MLTAPIPGIVPFTRQRVALYFWVALEFIATRNHLCVTVQFNVTPYFLGGANQLKSAPQRFERAVRTRPNSVLFGVSPTKVLPVTAPHFSTPQPRVYVSAPLSCRRCVRTIEYLLRAHPPSLSFISFTLTSFYLLCLQARSHSSARTHPSLTPLPKGALY